MLFCQIAFAKTHKTGSSTLQNILFRSKDRNCISYLQSRFGSKDRSCISYLQSRFRSKEEFSHQQVWRREEPDICHPGKELDVLLSAIFSSLYDQVGHTWKLYKIQILIVDLYLMTGNTQFLNSSFIFVYFGIFPGKKIYYLSTQFSFSNLPWASLGYNIFAFHRLKFLNYLTLIEFAL